METTVSTSASIRTGPIPRFRYYITIAIFDLRRTRNFEIGSQDAFYLPFATLANIIYLCLTFGEQQG